MDQNHVVVINESTASMFQTDINQSNEDANKKRKTSETASITLPKISQNVEVFMNQEWKFVDKLSLDIPLEPAVLKRIPHTASLFDVFLSFFTTSIWSFLLDIVNRNLAKNKSTQRKKKWYCNDITLNQLKQYYGIMMEIENTYGNNTRQLRKHHQAIKKRFPHLMGIDRFCAIRSALTPTIQELQQLCGMLTATFQSFVQGVSVVAVDESMLAYQPGKAKKSRANREGEPIPVQNMPRKPHPNGLLVYQLATWIENPCKDSSSGKLPFILDLHAHLQVADSAPHSLIIGFLKRWTLPFTPHVIADSAFGSLEVIKQIEELGFTATLSTPANGAADWLWDVLSHSLPSNYWRAAVKDNIVASVHHRRDEATGKSSYKQLLNSGVKFRLLKTHQASDSSSTSTSPTISTTSTTTNNNTADSGVPVIKRYTQQDLMGMTKPILEKLCKTHNIRKIGKNKEDIVKCILMRVTNVHEKHSEFTQLVTTVKTSFLAGEALCHEIYRRFFNLVDLADGYWYSVAQSHAMHYWTAKLLLDILKFATLNVWVTFQTVEEISWLSAREQIASILMNSCE